MESSSVSLQRFQFPSLLLKDWISLNWKSNKKTKQKQQTTLNIFWNCSFWTTCETINLLETITVISIITSHICCMDLTRTTQLGMVQLRLLRLLVQEGIHWWTSVICHSLHVFQWTLWRSVWRSGVIKTHTKRRIWSKQSPCSKVSSERKQKKTEFVHVVPLVVSIWLLLVSSVQGPRLHPRNGETSSEKQEPWVGLRLTRDSRLWGLVWVFQSQPVF